MLDVDDLWAAGDRGSETLRGVSLHLRAGEIVAIAGVAGNGQRELAETVTGMRRRDARDDRRSTAAGSAAAMRARRSAPASRTFPRTGCTPVSRRRSRSRRTSCSSRIAAARLARGPLLRLRAIREHAVQLIQRYDVRGGGPDLPARQLSGGNLQKVVLAREFEGEPRVLVVASPTRGLDVAAIETVHGYLRQAAAGGVGVLLISEDLDEILRARRPHRRHVRGRDRRRGRPRRPRPSRRSAC